jgi:ribose transport system substrate-binding protein
MTKFAGLVACLAVLCASTACNREKKRVVAVIPKGNAHLFWQSVHAGAVSASRESGTEIIWDGPASETDYTGQLKVVDAMINRRVDAIALAPIDSKAMVGVVERAASEGIPVIIFDSGIDTDKFVAQVATDNYHAGEMGAERLGKLLGGKGNVAMLANMPGSASTVARETGFENYMKKNFPGIQIVEKQFGNAEVATSLTKAENILTGHPNLDGIFASNESSSMGFAQALRDRKTRIKMVGFDWTPSLLDDVRNGVIDSLVVQNPFKMGEQAMHLALAKLDGKPFEKMNAIAPKIVDKQNVDTPEVQAQVNPDLKKYLQ